MRPLPEIAWILGYAGLLPFVLLSLTLLLGLFIGGQEIRPEHYAAMNQVVHYSALISLLFVMLAAWSSWQSGKVGQLVQQG